MDRLLSHVGLYSTPTDYCCRSLASILVSKVSMPSMSKAVSIISSIEGRHFTIKGHSYAPAAGFANINGGVTINITKLSFVAVNSNHTILDIYQYLDSLGLTIAGGRNRIAGITGLTLGGGAYDNAINFEVSGGNNFGIVTRWILGGNVINNLSYRDAVFKAFTNIAEAPKYNTYASLITGLTLSTTAIYTKPILNLPFNTLSITNLSILANDTASPQLNWAFFTGTYGASVTLLSQTFDSLNTTIYNLTIPNGITWSIAFEPLTTVITQHGDQNGGNSPGTSPNNGNTFMCPKVSELIEL
ncbi:FAD binding domain protein [Cenococcum geophilum]